MSIVTSIATLFVLFLLITSLASAIDLEDFKRRVKKPKGITIGLIAQYVILPLIAYLLTLIFSWKEPFAVALILVATCPGGVFSNFFCFLVGADLPLSIAMTTCSSLLSFAMIPLNGAIYITGAINPDDNLKIDYLSLFLSILVLMAGLVLGMYVTYKKYRTAQKILGILGAISVVIVVIASLYANLTSKYPIDAYSWKYWLGTWFLAIFAMIFGLLFAMAWKLPKPSCVSVGIETSNQNTGLAIAILGLTITDTDIRDQSLGIPIIYTIATWVVCLFFSILFFYVGWTGIEMEEGDNSVTFMTLVKRLKRYRTMKKQKTMRGMVSNGEVKGDDGGDGLESPSPATKEEVASSTDLEMASEKAGDEALMDALPSSGGADGNGNEAGAESQAIASNSASPVGNANEDGNGDGNGDEDDERGLNKMGSKEPLTQNSGDIPPSNGSYGTIAKSTTNSSDGPDNGIDDKDDTPEKINVDSNENAAVSAQVMTPTLEKETGL